jgi:hypothetical protein
VLGFSKHIHTAKTINLQKIIGVSRFYRQIKSCLVFIERLPKDQMFFSALNNFFKTRLLQTTSHPSVWSQMIIHTNHQ